MDAKSRRKIDMGDSALVVSRARPDSDAGYNVSLAQLEDAVARGKKAAAAQRQALVDLRTSTRAEEGAPAGDAAGSDRSSGRGRQARGEGGSRAEQVSRSRNRAWGRTCRS